jgi:hypothetical protein
VEVEKTGFSSALTRGYIVPCDFSYSQEQEPLFQDAFAVTAICIQAQTANIFARFFTFETGRLPLETDMYSPLM